MAYPGLPTHIGGRYIYGPIDPELSTWLLIDTHLGQAIGWIFDDTTPDLVRHWLPLARILAKERGWKIFVLVGPGNIGWHHKGCVNFLEVYWKCEGMTLWQFIRDYLTPRRARYKGYVMPRYFGWQESGGGPECVPTPKQYWRLRKWLARLRPKYGLWDF